MLLDARGRVLLCRRRPGGRFGLRWEVPGGKVEPGESARRALARELREELGIEVRPRRLLMRLEHRYDGGPTVRLEFFETPLRGGRLRNLEFHEVRWVPRSRLGRYDVLEADAPLIRLLAAGHP